MKKLMMAVAVVGLSSGAAHAQSATQRIELNAFVDTYCNIGNSVLPTARIGTIPVVSQRVSAGLVTIGSTQDTVACSTNATITLTSANAGLSNPSLAATNPSAAFANKIHYSAEATYNGQNVRIDTSTSSTGPVTATSLPTIGGAQTAGTLGITVTAAATEATKLLVGGSYNDLLTVTITPTP